MDPYKSSSYSPSYSYFSYSADTYRPSRSKDPRLQPRTRRSSRSRSRSPERHHGSSSSSSQRVSSGSNHTSRSRELSGSRTDIIREQQSRTLPTPSPSQSSSITPPRPATPPRGMTGTNNVPLAPRRSARNQSNTPTAINAVTAGTLPTTSSSNVSSLNSLSTVTSLAKGVAPINTGLSSDTTKESKRMKKYREYMEGPPDPPADIIVWIAVSARVDRKVKRKSTILNCAYALVWEKGPFQHVSQTFSGEDRSSLYAEFAAVSHILDICPGDATVLIKTTGAGVMDAFVQSKKPLAKLGDEVNALRQTVKRQVRNRRGRVHWKKVPARVGLPLNDTASSMAEGARKRLEQQTVDEISKQQDQRDTIQRKRAQQMQVAAGSITSPTTSPSTSQAQSTFYSSSPLPSQGQAVEPQRREMKSPTIESDRLAVLLREKALASMRSENRHPASSPSPTTNNDMGSPDNNKGTSNGESSINIIQATHIDEDGRLTKAIKANRHTSAPQQQRQREQYFERLHQHGSGSQQPRDPRLQRKEPAANTTSTTLSSSLNLPRLTRSTNFPPVASRSYGRNGNLKEREQNVIRSSPRTNTVVSRGLSMDNRRSNDHAIQASLSLSKDMVNGSNSTNAEVPTHKVQKNNEVHGTDNDSDDEFYDALDHWVGKYREDHGDDDDDDGDDDGYEKNDGSGSEDPSAALSWISNIL